MSDRPASSHRLCDRCAAALDGVLGEPAGSPLLPFPRTPEGAAKWLAAESGHPRYTDQMDGWRLIMQSRGNIEHAYRAATAVQGTAQRVIELWHAREVLLHAGDATRR